MLKLSNFFLDSDGKISWNPALSLSRLSLQSQVFVGASIPSSRRLFWIGKEGKGGGPASFTLEVPSVLWVSYPLLSSLGYF
jgi:hypothetical protein